jgi:hypothetical protein
MVRRAYVLLRTDSKRRDLARDILERQPGVIAVDLVDGPPDIMVVLEAAESQRLASHLLQAMTSVQDFTDSVDLLPAMARGCYAAPGTTVT